MLPPFDLQGGPSLAGARDIAVSALLSAFGTLTFRVLVAPRALAKMPYDTAHKIKRVLLLVTQLSILASILGFCVWLFLQAAYMADAGSISESLSAIPTVLTKTVFGHVIACQLATLVLLALVTGLHDRDMRQKAALGVAIVAVFLQAGHSHALSMYGGLSFLLVCDVAHLLGAGAWLGGLLPLLLLVKLAPPPAGGAAARWFSPLGQCCIVALLASAAFQGWVLVGSIPGLIGTAYGYLVLVKIALFGVLFAFAVANRYRFAPALLRENPDAAKKILIRSMTVQTGFAIAILIAAVVLSELPPAMHEQALWPFAQQISLAAVREDPDFQREVIEAAAALGTGMILLCVTLVLRRFRLPALALALIIAWFAIPHFDVLLAQAYPTSFYHSPTGFTSAAIADGSTIYAQNCVMCHGATGHGDGPAAKTLPVPPADLTAAHLWMHSDGELFWWLTHGMEAPEGGLAMPAFAGILDDTQRWDAIDYIRAHNAGNSQHETGMWPHPIQAPALGAQCAGTSITLADLRGKFVRLVIGQVPADADAPGVTTIVANFGDAAAPPNVCISRDETVAAAYAIVAGLDPHAMTGTQFLIDDQGWLRAVQTPQTSPGWNDAKMLQAEITTLHSQKRQSAAPAPMSMDMKM
jgi:putative copper export protein/mono/diheme cytochrome c family protein